MAAPAALCAAVTAEGSGRHKAWNFRSVRSRETDLWSGGRFGRRPLARIEILALDFHIEAIEGDAVRIRQESRQWIGNLATAVVASEDGDEMAGATGVRAGDGVRNRS
jgi:hypothetical protein